MELAVSAVLLVTVSIGILDAARLLGARSALSEGVAAGLRCLHPVEGSCANGASGGRALYDVYRYERNPVYLVPAYFYSARASAIERATYAFRRPSASVLGSVHYEIARSRLIAQRGFYPAAARSEFLIRQYDFPLLRGRSTEAEALLPDGSGRRYPAARELDLSALEGVSAGSSSLGSARFTIDRPVRAELPCFLPGAGGADFARPCEQVWPWIEGERFSDGRSFELPSTGAETGEYTYAVLLIEGRRIAASAGARGAVTISLSDGERDLELGGRRLDNPEPGSSADEPANFVPRGAPLGFVSTSDARRYEELALYQAIKIPYGRKIQLRFRLEAESGRVGWRGERLRIFTPIYQHAVAQVPCADSLSRSAIRTGNGCRLPDPRLPLLELRQLASEPVRSEPALDLGCGRPEDPHALASLAGLADPGDYDMRWDGEGGCQPLKLEAVCPENLGVAGEPDPSDGLLRGSRDALALCPPPAAGRARVGSPAWSLERRELPERAFEWEPRDCASDGPGPEELPEPLARYARLDLGVRETIGFRPMPDRGGLSEPACPHLRLRDESLTGIAGPGAIPDLGCTWEEAIAREAARRGFAAPLWRVVPLRSWAGEAALTSAPADSCTPYRTGYLGGGSRTLLARALPIEAARIACPEPEECAMEPVGKDGASLAGDDLALAESFAFREISASYPRARRGCRGDDCVRLGFSRAGTTLRASATIELPLLMLLGKSIAIEEIGERSDESAPPNP